MLNAGVSRVVMTAGIEPTSLTSVRLIGAAAIFGLWVLFTDRKFFRPPNGRELLDIVLLGIFGVLLVQLGYHIALMRLPIGISILLEYLAPIWVLLWVRFVRREPVRNRMWLAVVMAVTGMAVVGQIWSGFNFDAIGVTAALLAGVAFAIYFLLGEVTINRSDPLFVIFWTFVVAAIAINFIWPFWEVDIWTDSASFLGPFEDFTAPVWAILIWVSFAGAVLPFFLQLKALHFIPPTIVTMVAMLEPVGAIFLGWFWFSERFTFVQIIGAATIVLAIMLAQSARIKPPADLPTPN